MSVANSIILGVALIVFFILALVCVFLYFKNEKIKDLKEEQERTGKELQKMIAEYEHRKMQNSTYAKEKAENEKLKNESINPTLSGHNASIDLLQDIAEKGQRRNSK